MNTKAAINGLFFVTLLLSGAWAFPAHAQLQLVSCSEGQGTITFSPAITTTPTNVQATATIDHPNCTGSGITAAQTVTTFTMVAATCLSGTNVAVSALNNGTTTVTWTGGTGPATTTFTQTYPVLTQVDLGTQLAVGLGLSTSGRFDGFLPAVLQRSASATGLACPSISGGDVVNGQLLVVPLL